MSTCDWSDLETLGYRPIMYTNLPLHTCAGLVSQGGRESYNLSIFEIGGNFQNKNNKNHSNRQTPYYACKYNHLKAESVV